MQVIFLACSVPGATLSFLHAALGIIFDPLALHCTGRPHFCTTSRTYHLLDSATITMMLSRSSPRMSRVKPPKTISRQRLPTYSFPTITVLFASFKTITTTLFSAANDKGYACPLLTMAHSLTYQTAMATVQSDIFKPTKFGGKYTTTLIPGESRAGSCKEHASAYLV